MRGRLRRPPPTRAPTPRTTRRGASAGRSEIDTRAGRVLGGPIVGSAEEEGAARLGDLLDGVVPEAVRKVYRERRAKAAGAKRAVAKAERAVVKASAAVQAAGETLPALPVPEVPR